MGYCNKVNFKYIPPPGCPDIWISGFLGGGGVCCPFLLWHAHLHIATYNTSFYEAIPNWILVYLSYIWISSILSPILIPHPRHSCLIIPFPLYPYNPYLPQRIFSHLILWLILYTHLRNKKVSSIFLLRPFSLISTSSILRYLTNSQPLNGTYSHK